MARAIVACAFASLSVLNVLPRDAAAELVPLVPIPLSAASPQPFVPILVAPPLPTTPLARGLAEAYGAASSAPDPVARARAAQAYARALMQADGGDAVGALALARAAQATAASGRPVLLAPLASSVGNSGGGGDAARTSAALLAPPGRVRRRAPRSYRWPRSLRAPRSQRAPQGV
ncbi:MAG: hypothetical protein NVS3B17_23600 [Vulcanimicrobiaceae bacterium]